ncbi:helix-turn-helix transcriptional regulator [Actinokineospora globicatena]|uniref:helix-turn-helix transcriptional regulator n=1 Tax=Actinokineospora globicatena TaxID=103729 RepID=UPI0032DBB751
MTYRERRPPRGTGAGVACVWSRESSNAEDSTTVTVVPDACVDVMWERQGGRLWVAGPDTRAHPARNVSLVGLRFRPGDTALGLPVSELLDARVDLDDLWGSRAGELLSRLEASTGVDEAQRILLAALPTDPDPAIGAIRALAATGETVRGMADELGLSERQLNRRSHAAFGYGPKTLHRVLRFQQALTLARQGLGFAEVAYRAGYADQPHLAREVRTLAGQSLGELTSGRKP